MAADDSVCYDSRPVMFRNKPLVFALLWVFLIAPLVVLIAFRDQVLAISPVLAVLLMVISGLCGLAIGIWFLKKRATRLRITNGEVHLEEGLLRKRHIDLHVSQIRAVHVTQTYADRIMRVGQIDIFTTGDNPEFSVAGMTKPHRVRELVREFQRNDRASA